MQEQPFDADAIMERGGELMRQVRSSDAYPALLGGIAGGIAGACMAAIIASRVSHSRVIEEPLAVEEKSAGKGWDLREIIQLATVGATLLKQAQSWYEERKQGPSRYS